MKDSLDNLLPETNGETEETKAPVVAEENGTVTSETEKAPEEAAPAQEATPTEAESANEVVEVAADAAVVAANKTEKEDIINKLSEMVIDAADAVRTEVEALKQAYYKLRRNEIEDAKKAFLEAGGEEKEFKAPVDEYEVKMKELLATFKEKRAAQLAEEERVKQANYDEKLQLIERVKALIVSQDDFNKLYNEFKEIQQRWKEIKAVPQELSNDLWKNYQTYTEQFYDLIKINNQMREYDFKKNLEMKTALCETVEKLQEETDVISAFHQLQKLHTQWREIGPVSKELREEIWQRFKAASSIVNKRHQEHFEALKSREQENLTQKEALCEEAEAIDYESLKSFKEWDAKNKEVIELQDKWKTIGFAPKKANQKVFERFRAACDVFFTKKAEYFKSVKADLEKNLEAKRALCEKAEELKDSDDWKTTSDKMIALQKEWKKTGPVPRKYSDTIWKRFITACDYFFEQKNKNFVSQKSVEQTNLAAKKELITQIKELDITTDPKEALATLKEYIAKWNEIGFVPFREKDKIYKEYHEAIDKQFDQLKVDKNERRMQSFRSNLSDMAGGEQSKGRLFNERDRLMRTFERMKAELQTYENNIGFLSISSKGGGGLVKEMERKMEKLKDDMALVIKKIEAIDENLD